jgi:hypothetical protein
MSVIPSDYTFEKAIESVRIKRLPVRAQSDTQSYTTGGKIQITLPSDFSDLRGSYLTFNAIAPANGGTYVRFSYPVQTMIQRAQVYLGSKVIEDIDDQAVIQGMFKGASSYDSVNNLTTEGAYLAATRATQTNAGRLYTVHMRLESLERVWPLHKIKMPLRIVLTLWGSTPYFMEYDGSAPTVTISDIFLNYHSLQVPDDVSAMLDASIASGNCRIKFHSWDNYNVQLSSATSNTLMLPFKRKCVNAILAVWRDAADISSAAVDGKYTDQFEADGIIQTYVKVATQVYPSDKYEMNYNFGYLLMSPVFNSIMNDRFHAYDRQQDTFALQAPATRCGIGAYDLRLDNSPKSDGLWGNGVDTSQSANSQQLGLLFSAAPGALAVDVFAKYEASVTVLPNGGIELDC